VHSLTEKESKRKAQRKDEVSAENKKKQSNKKDQAQGKEEIDPKHNRSKGESPKLEIT
jgi:hypothetical protein